MSRRCGARGSGSQVRHSGGAGAPPGDTMVPCQELADDPRVYSKRASPLERQKRGAPRAKARPGKPNKRRYGAPKGARAFPARGRELMALRFSARHSPRRACGEGTSAQPGRSRVAAMEPHVRALSARRSMHFIPPLDGVGGEDERSEIPPGGAEPLVVDPTPASPTAPPDLPARGRYVSEVRRAALAANEETCQNTRHAKPME
jgi:hypothetical protein